MRSKILTFWLYGQACILGIALALMYSAPQSETAGAPHGRGLGARQRRKPFEIGMLIFTHSSLTDTLMQEFERWFNVHSTRPCHIQVHSANGNYMTLDIMAQKLLLSKYDLIWAAGFQPVQTIAHKLTKEAPAAPILATSISKDAVEELSAQNPFFSRYVTGWYGTYNWELRIELLTTLLPTTKNALFFYHTSRQPHYLRAMNEELTRRGIRCTQVGVTDVSDALNYVRAHPSEIDIIIVMREAGLVAIIDNLILLANKYRIPLYVSDSASVYKGAACGVCSDEQTFARYSAWFAKKLLVDGYKTQRLPFVEIKDWSVRAMVNNAAYVTQNARIPENILFLMQHSFIYHPETICEE